MKIPQYYEPKPLIILEYLFLLYLLPIAVNPEIRIQQMKPVPPPAPGSVIDSDLQQFIDKMRATGALEQVINVFSSFYRQFRSGKRGLIRENTISPVLPRELRTLEDLAAYRRHGTEALPRTVVIKLNGGLGTTMGCSGPKSLIHIKEGYHFLDITIRQLLDSSRKTGTDVPLLLMNSFNTDAESLAALDEYSELPDSLPRSFLQNKFPRIDAESLLPVTWAASPRLEWNPPGHGDIYTALLSTGLLRQLLERGFRYAFISNIDNLGAVLEPALLGYLVGNSLSFLMEVTARTAMDRKGGHITRRSDGSLLLRESIQCPEEDMRFFQDIYRHRFFNTNNLWIDLTALDEQLTASEGVLQLPLLCNKKYVDAADPNSPLVYQLESAMGSALSVLPNTGAVDVPRSRFIPVKTCEELLLLRSDYYTLADDFRISAIPELNQKPPELTLDSRFFGTVDQLDERFKNGIPSLRHCHRLSVEGNVSFGQGCSIIGDAMVANRTDTPFTVPDNSTLSGDLRIGD
jgi:UTP--glucose-1-phosphate uridylyltransferase